MKKPLLLKMIKRYIKKNRELRTKLALLQCALDGANDKLLYCGGKDILPDYDHDYGREQLNALHQANRWSTLDEAYTRVMGKLIDCHDDENQLHMWYNKGIHDACSIIDTMKQETLEWKSNSTE